MLKKSAYEIKHHSQETKREIRKMLHPTINEEFLPKNDHYLPGGFLTLNTLVAMQNGEQKVTKRIRTNNKFYTRKKEFDKFGPSNFEVPIIRNASPYVVEE